MDIQVLSKVNETIDKILPEVISIRRQLHANPEIAYEEFCTAKLISDTLAKYGIAHTNGIAKTGVCADLRGKSGKTLLLRADMDALAIQEQNDLPYSSKNPGAMHACGHDVHVAIMLGTAIVINEILDYVNGNVKLIFQPAEEGVGGALPMIEEGVMDSPKVDAAISLHIMPGINVGQVQLKKGLLTATPCDFTIEVIGKGGHGALPQNCVDPIVMAAQFITATQTIISRRLDPLDNACLTIGKINGGTFNTTIPDSVTLEGSLRCFGIDECEAIMRMLEQTLAGITNAYGGSYKMDYYMLYPPVVNDDDITDIIADCAAELLGADNVKWAPKPQMIGEDFAYFGQRVPACMYYLGSGFEGRDNAPLHNACFEPNEDCIAVGIRLNVAAVLEYLLN